MPCIPSTHESSGVIHKYINCRLVRGGKIILDDLWVRNGKFVDPKPIFYEEKVRPDYVVDCHGALICPGFLDIQINGGFGYDFSSDLEQLQEGLTAVAKGVLSSGVTSFCPTLVTSPPSVYHKVLPQVERTTGGLEGAGILGMHLEGPYISIEKKGAHPAQYIRGLEGGMNEVEETYSRLDNVAIITIAPEKPGALDVIRHLTQNGVVVSLGHSNANLEEGEAGAKNGATFMTHLFNAMLPFHHRDPGLVGLMTSRFIPHPVFYGIIADGIHTHPAALRIAYRTHPKGLVLVTDAMAAMGLGEGEHQIGQMKVIVTGRSAHVAGTNTLAGSIATMDECIRRLMNGAGVSLVEAVECCSLHPAQVLGISHQKGTLDFGTDADFVMVSENPFKVLNTFIGGKCVYKAPEAPELVVKPLN